MPDVTPAVFPAPSPWSVICQPDLVFEALAEPKRRAILQLLIDRGPLGVQAIAAALGRQETLIGRHLITLRQAELIAPIPSPDGDGRRQCYEIPAHFRARDANGKIVLDYGVAALRMNAPAPPAPAPEAAGAPVV